MDLAQGTQTALIVLLGILVVVLSLLLVFRIKAEKRQRGLVAHLDADQFIDFLRSNSVEGTIQVVAQKVSDLLKTTFGCERIVFLRKQRGFLELNYYHGIRKFNRNDFRMRFTPRLVAVIRDSFAPRAVDVLHQDLPETLRQRLDEHELDVFFPIFWRDNLYGLYFIKSPQATKANAFGLWIAGLAQSLSAAYHIKWHEARYERLQQRLSEEGGTPAAAPTRIPNSILKLVRHRDSEGLVAPLVESLQQELGASKLVYLFEPKSDQQSIQVVVRGLTSRLMAPERQAFAELLAKVKPDGVTEVDALLRGQTNHLWPQQLHDAGIKYLTRFALSDRRLGLLAISGEHSAGDLARQLGTLQPSTRELYSNAEQFEQVEAMSYTDNLTGLANHRYFCKRLSEEIDRARRYHRSLALIMFDMDDLKGINDRYGHQAGDTVLRRMGQILRASIRAIDIIARYGGDEFCVIMPEADGETCERFMQRLQGKIAGSRFTLPELGLELSFTISQGGATFPDHAQDADRLLYAADMALLKAKEMGRNTSRLYGVESPTEK